MKFTNAIESCSPIEQEDWLHVIACNESDGLIHCQYIADAKCGMCSTRLRQVVRGGVGGI
jgi:hypothetical protein